MLKARLPPRKRVFPRRKHWYENTINSFSKASSKGASEKGGKIHSMCTRRSSRGGAQVLCFWLKPQSAPRSLRGPSLNEDNQLLLRRGGRSVARGASHIYKNNKCRKRGGKWRLTRRFIDSYPFYDTSYISSRPNDKKFFCLHKNFGLISHILCLSPPRRARNEIFKLTLVNPKASKPDAAYFWAAASCIRGAQ